LGFRNFTHQDFLPFDKDEEHGTKVLSCMLANKPGEMVGTAPGADYYLIQTEVSDEEYKVEEDYWVAGIEYADSLGVDIVTSSLGYTTFDEVSMNHTHSELDGKKAQISKAATMASEKGMLLFVAAGNERNKEWEKIGFPADADGLITVGGVDSKKEVSYFSSVGYTVDGRVKPDLMAKGTGVSVVYQSGRVYPYANGTSFSTPILAGLGACLWQALPDLTNIQMIDLLRKNADRSQHPDSLYGNGIPDVFQAYSSMVSKATGISFIEKNQSIFYFNSTTGFLYINLSVDDCVNSHLQVFSVLGNLVLRKKSLTGPIDMRGLTKGMYIACLECNGKRYVRKFIKL
jgi:subtilisin family serine protease